MTATGCTWIMGQTLVRGKPVNVFCNKLLTPGSVFCPKHVLFHEDRKTEPERKAVKAAATRKWKAQQAKVLSESPLRAHNPNFEKRERQ